MLNKETTDHLKKCIKEINKENEIDRRITLMIDLKDKTRNALNEALDDIFADINLVNKRSVLNEEKFLQ